MEALLFDNKMDRALHSLQSAKKSNKLKKGSISGDPINIMLKENGVKADYFSTLDKWMRNDIDDKVKQDIKELEQYFTMDELYLLDAAWEGSFYDPYTRRTIDTNIDKSCKRIEFVLKTIAK